MNNHNKDNLEVNIEGIEIQNLEKYRIDSPAGGLEFISVPNNVFNTPAGVGTEFLMVTGFY